MIRTLTFRSRLDGKDPGQVSEAIRAQVGKLVRRDNTLRGVRVTVEGDVIDVALRVTGQDRWRIAGHARKTASLILATQRLPYERPLYPVQEVTEPSARSLTLTQGRVPQSRTGGRPRRRTGSATPPGSEDHPWWGDPLPQEE